MTTSEWEAVIGLETHVQLQTRSKIFSATSTAYGAEPNRQAGALDLAMPGLLPVLNGAAVRMAIRFGLAVGGTIAPRSVFARKNYFYPDLPKGYQISQDEHPIVLGGVLEIRVDREERRAIQLTRAHLEEDAGKSLHEDLGGLSGIDLNRAGTPLLEIVSEPELRSAAEAASYMRALHTLVRYLEICDGNMQEGSFRCDANVSLRRRGSERLGTRTEIKNLNSFRFLERAIEYEIARQIEVLESGRDVIQETRLYDADRNETRAMRTKEEAVDYRYFPDPDLQPLHIDPALIADVARQMPELPEARRERLGKEYGLSAYEAEVLTTSRELADYFEGVAGEASHRLAATWVMGELLGALNRDAVAIEDSPISSAALAGLLRRIEDQTISGTLAKQVFEAMWQGEGDADAVIEARGLRQITDTAELDAIVVRIIQEHPAQVAEYRAGKERLLGFFVGQAMRATRGKANPAQLNELIRRKLAGE